MHTKMFGHRSKRNHMSERDPGEPINHAEMDHSSMGRSRDNPPSYEGKEHVSYKNPGFSSHHIRYPEDEPHMKSHSSSEEAHEMEDDYHMGVPHQTAHSLAKVIKRSRMKMDAPDQEDPDALRGNMVHNVGYEGDEDTSGEEEMGPNDMQSDEHKEHRKKMIVAVMRRKMKKDKD